LASDDSCRRELPFTIAWDEVEKDISAVVGRLRRQARIPGFRPGKAPVAVVRGRYWNEIKQEILEKLLPRVFWSTVDEDKLSVAGKPEFSDLHFEQNEPVVFKVLFEVFPEFELAEYRRLEAPFREPEVASEEIDQEIERLRQQHVSYRNLDSRPLKDGDIAVLSLKSDPAPDTPQVDQDDVMIAIGEDETLPEFSENLRGKSPGERVDFEVHYPENFSNEKLAGKRVPFHAEVKGLREKELPDLDDDFASEIGDYASVDALRTAIKEAFEKHRRDASESMAKDKLIETLIERHDFPVPVQLVDRQVATRAERSLRMLSEQGVDASSLDLSWDKIRDKEHDGAVTDIKASLILGRIAEAENITVSSEELDHQVSHYAEQAKQSVAATRKKLAEDGTLDRISGRMRNEKTLNFLFDEAVKVDPEPVDSLKEAADEA
jgi:trigger factor